MNSPWIVVFLGIVALGAVIQVAFLVGLVLFGLRAARRAQRLTMLARTELQQPLAHLSETALHVKGLSSVVADEARELRASARGVADDVRAAKEDVRRAVRSPFIEAKAMARAVTRAVSTFRNAPSRPRPSPPDSVERSPSDAGWARAHS